MPGNPYRHTGSELAVLTAIGESGWRPGGRVTEQLVKNQNLVILKHSSCTVIGWDLHVGDRVQEPGPERFLKYLPQVIYLKFDDASWVVHEDLGPGVWPMTVVHRTWILNRTSETKIKRAGFTLLPDYASTAFMIQGATLAAAIADCGDVADAGGLSELMTTYVILSRVKSANGLLLLRAFCPNLFQKGPLPGPSCLLKLLRHRFAASAHDTTFSPQDAIAEYQRLIAQYNAGRAQHKKHGASWQCGACHLRFPAAAYDVDEHDVTDLHDMCIGLGHLRMCTACMQVRVPSDSAPTSGAPIPCRRCEHLRAPHYFVDDGDICNPCRLQMKYNI